MLAFPPALSFWRPPQSNGPINIVPINMGVLWRISPGVISAALQSPAAKTTQITSAGTMESSRPLTHLYRTCDLNVLSTLEHCLKSYGKHFHFRGTFLPRNVQDYSTSNRPTVSDVRDTDFVEFDRASFLEQVAVFSRTAWAVRLSCSPRSTRWTSLFRPTSLESALLSFSLPSCPSFP